MSGSVDRKVKPPWRPRKRDKVHIWFFGWRWVPERTAFVLVVVVSIAAILIVIANIT